MRTFRHVFPAAAIALLVGAALVAMPPVARAGSIETDEPREQSEDPTEITFTLRVRAPAGLASAMLAYKVLNPDGNVGGSGNGAFGPGAETDVTFALETRSAQRYIPVGSIIVYHWELVDRDGTELATPERQFTFLDGRYTWRERVDGSVTVFWYGNNEQNASAALRSAQGVLDDIGALLETEVPYPIRLVVYRTESDGDLARRPRGRVFEEQVVTGGQRVAPDLLLIFAPDSDVVRHELAHVVTHVAGDGPFTSLPSWLDEGVAVYAQSSPGIGYRSAVEFGIAADNTLSLRTMQSPSNLPNEVNLFYGQSFSTVDFLIDEFGRAQFAELFRVHFAGSPIDDALEQVYGFDQNGLYNEWRAANDLSRLNLTAPPSGTTVPQAEATRAPIAVPTSGAAAPAPTSEATSEASAATSTGDEPSGGPATSDGGSNTAAGIAVGGVTLLFVALLGGGALFLLRRGRERS